MIEQTLEVAEVAQRIAERFKATDPALVLSATNLHLSCIRVLRKLCEHVN